jgi:cyclophilin family peptidyl-prolyl cis-trans isomerase
LIGAIAAALASGPDDGPLVVHWLYYGVDRPVPVTVRPPAGGTAQLALLDADGGALVPAIATDAGVVDLATLIPDIWRLRRAAYLQLVVDDEPVGSSLVLQPMLSRLVPVEEEATNPRGVRYTKMTDWHDELDPEDAVDDRAEDLSRAWLADDPERGRLFSGLRIYPDRDVIMRTTHGDIRLAMRPDEAPNTAWNFLALCEGGFYRDVAFHRVAPMNPAGEPFVIQAGDPTMTGSGGPGYWLPIERSGLEHDFGVVSMARDVDPDSAGSQIFICLSRAGTARLDGHYCAFGHTVSGRDTIKAIADVELADVARGRPMDPPIIQSALLVPAPPRRPGVGRPDRPQPRDDPDAPPSDRLPR